MPERTVRLALAQMAESPDLGRNLRRMTALAEEAAGGGARLVLFPECALTGYGPACHRDPADFDAEAVAAAVAALRDVSRAAGVALVAGAHLPAPGGWTNSALLISPRRAPARYDKTHLYGQDSRYYRAGSRPSEPLRAAGLCLGMQICFDLRFPEPFRRLALQGVQAVAVPAHIAGRADMWKGPVIEAHVRSRAAENGRFVLFINAAGPDQNAPSMIADPRGCLLAACRPRREELLLAELDLDQVSDAFIACRRPDLYADERPRTRPSAPRR